MIEYNKKYQELIESYNPNKMKSYLDNRKKSAQDAADKAKEKGGDAMASFYHFDAKVKAYDKCYKIVKKDDKLIVLQEKSSDSLKELKKFKNMTQKVFQKIVGELEVWGELFIKCRENS